MDTIHLWIMEFSWRNPWLLVLLVVVPIWSRRSSGGSRLWRSAALLDGTVTADPRHAWETGNPSRCETQQIPRAMGQLHHLHISGIDPALSHNYSSSEVPSLSSHTTQWFEDVYRFLQTWGTPTCIPQIVNYFDREILGR